MILLGVLILLYTVYEVFVAEADTLFVSDWLWFEISRWKHPFTYWTILVIQGIFGVGFLAAGIMETLSPDILPF